MEWICFFFLFIILAVSQGRQAKRKRIKDAYTFNPEKTQASGGFAKSAALWKAGYFRRGGIRIGFSPGGWRPLHYLGSGHGLVVAAARSGKLLTIIAAMILSLPKRYSLLIVDPKAEITCVVAAWRKLCGRVYVWNPYKLWLNHMKGVTQASINPVADIDPKSITLESDCKKLVSTFWDESETHKDPHWGPSGKALFAGIVQCLVMYGIPEEKNLPTARTILTGANGASIHEFARYVMTHPDPHLREAFARFAAKGAEDNDEIRSIISTAITQTDFLSNRAIADSLTKADVSFRSMKKQAGMTVSVCLPLNRLDDSKCFSLLSGWMLHCVLEEGQMGSKVPCVAVIDEMSQIGYSKAWQDAFGLAAGAAGLQIIAVYQDVNQILNQFNKGFQTLIQNCGFTLWFGARDAATRKMISDLAGFEEVLVRNRSVSMNPNTGEPHVSDGASTVLRPVIRPEEAGALKGDEMVAFLEGVAGPVKAKRKPYLSEFRGKYRPNPYVSKKTGSLFGWLNW